MTFSTKGSVQLWLAERKQVFAVQKIPKNALP